MYLKIVGLSEFGRFDTSAKLYSGYVFLYCFIKLHATSCVLKCVLIPSILFFSPYTSKTTIEYSLGRLCGLAFRSQANAKMNTDPKITYSPANLKNAKMIPGIVSPNKTIMKFENEITAITVMRYVFQSKTL